MDLIVVLDRHTAWLDTSRQSSAAKGNMGGSPPYEYAIPETFA